MYFDPICTIKKPVPPFKRVKLFWVSVSVPAVDGIVALGKAITCSARSLSSIPKVALDTVAMLVWWNTGCFPAWEDGMSADSCFCFLFLLFWFILFLFFVFYCLHAISALMPLPVLAQKVPQASEKVGVADGHNKTQCIILSPYVIFFSWWKAIVPLTDLPETSKVVLNCWEMWFLR